MKAALRADVSPNPSAVCARHAAGATLDQLLSFIDPIVDQDWAVCKLAYIRSLRQWIPQSREAREYVQMVQEAAAEA